MRPPASTYSLRPWMEGTDSYARSVPAELDAPAKRISHRNNRRSIGGLKIDRSRQGHHHLSCKNIVPSCHHAAARRVSKTFSSSRDVVCAVQFENGVEVTCWRRDKLPGICSPQLRAVRRGQYEDSVLKDEDSGACRRKTIVHICREPTQMGAHSSPKDRGGIVRRGRTATTIDRDLVMGCELAV